MIRAALLDVGGTLWPNSFGIDSSDRSVQVRAVAGVLGADVEEADWVITALRQRLEHDQAYPLYRPVVQVIAETLAATGCPPERAHDVRKAMCVHVGSRIVPHEGATRLLEEVHQAQLSVAVVSNTTFRAADDYVTDFDALGWSDYIDAVITSLDVGRPKPDAHMFRAALDVLEASPGETAMVGNSEAADIAPAKALGIRTILVAIEDPVPTHTDADAVATSLTQALDIITAWSH